MDVQNEVRNRSPAGLGVLGVEIQFGMRKAVGIDRIKAGGKSPLRNGPPRRLGSRRRKRQQHPEGVEIQRVAAKINSQSRGRREVNAFQGVGETAEPVL